ncbi:MAG: TetR/AcrR family transcriptional regulator [Xanthomonadaceae bacterium]|nr:TetR/AcrR family transcriptional regulator [Xanthomonadaceae bacterium]
MAHRAGRKEESRARILASAGRGFRKQGYGGLGIDALAKEAGVTSGAFYGHFKSKSAAFRDAVTAGLGELQRAILDLRATSGARWCRRLVDFYLGERLACDLSESCALQSLTGDVARADDDVREAYEAEFGKVVAAMADGLQGGSGKARRADALALLALLTGGVSLARAVKDQALGKEIAEAVRASALRITQHRLATPNGARKGT